MKRRLLVLIIILIIGVTFVKGLSAQPPSPYKLPTFFAVTSFEVGTSHYNTTSMACEGITQLTGQKFRILPSTTDTGRFSSLRAGAVHFLASGTAAPFAAAGRAEFSDISWGPQNFRIVWCAAFPGNTFLVLGDSGIKKTKDLIGKRIGYVDGSPGTTIQYETLLAFGDLKWKDVKIVKIPGLAAGGEALLSNTIDVVVVTTTSGSSYRVESSSHGLGYIEMPLDDTEGWKRVKEVIPFAVPYLAVTGAGVSKEKPLQCYTYANPIIVTSPDQNPDWVYWMTKALVEAYPIFSKKAEILKTNWTLDWNLKLTAITPIPTHPGAIRYFKEIGKWTPELEAHNQEMLKKEEFLIDLWDRTLTLAKNQNIKASDFPAFWEKMRTAAGPKFKW